MLNENNGFAEIGALLNRLADGAGFDETDWGLLLDLTSGTSLYEPDVIRFFQAEVEDSEEFHFEKWGVARNDIVTKVKRLDALGRLAVVHRIDNLRSEVPVPGSHG